MKDVFALVCNEINLIHNSGDIFKVSSLAVIAFGAIFITFNMSITFIKLKT